MKITQKLFVLLFAGVLAIAMSCEENVVEPDVLVSGANTVLGDSTMTSDWQEVESSALPQSILDYVTENHPDEEIKESWLTDEGEYLVVLNRDLILIFDADGNFVEEYDHKEHRGDRDPIDISELPQSVLDYITANYPDAEIKKAYVNDEGEYIVKLDNRMVLVFDSAGNFLEEFEKERRRRGKRFWEKWDEIEVSELPQAVLDYIAANYPDDEIIITGINEDGEYGVILSSKVALLFDADGNFLEAIDADDLRDDDDDYDDWEEIEISELPQAILDYVANNYPDETIDDAGKNRDGEYGIILSNDVILIFDADGNFLEAYEDDHDYEDCDEVDIADLPQAILDYLAANHPDDEIEGAWYDEDEEIFIIELSSDVYVIFDKDGNYMETEDCEEDDDDDDDDDDEEGGDD